MHIICITLLQKSPRSILKVCRVELVLEFHSSEPSSPLLKYDAGARLLKSEGGGADTFPIEFFQGLSFLHLEITLPLQNCVMHFKKKYFFLLL